jgi:hypothetical protein
VQRSAKLGTSLITTSVIEAKKFANKIGEYSLDPANFYIVYYQRALKEGLNIAKKYKSSEGKDNSTELEKDLKKERDAIVELIQANKRAEQDKWKQDYLDNEKKQEEKRQEALK